MSFRLTLEVQCPSDWNEDYANLVMVVLNCDTELATYAKCVKVEEI